ncbi:MAG TPA: Stp1/IreP family PP2C-type Ser/Thr phosphatase [Gaiellaceae bacterium]|nr:Stp1/IreP family PP2C-type Ser/Thr phosphatase [Gaiellaceae bacterium]
MKIGQVAAKTDPGRKRRGNEDSFVCRPPLFAIADGMGGAQAGEVASALAVEPLNESRVDAGGERKLAELVQEANRRVHDRATNDAATSGMGTTITVALVEPDGHIAFGHVGDSRAYRLRGDALEQVTNDHSLVAELVRRGELSPEEAEVHPQRSVITRALGTDPDIDVDTFTVDAQPGDVYLICSDGLSDMVDRGELESIMRAQRANLDDMAKALVQAANRAGGEDNITAVLFEIAEGEMSQEPDEATAEQATLEANAVHIEEEDTLHPEDGVMPPPALPPRDDTMVVPASAIQAAMSEAAAEEEEYVAGAAHKALALLVILVLILLIVVLVWWGLAR